MRSLTCLVLALCVLSSAACSDQKKGTAASDSDLLVIVDTPNGDNVAKFALATGATGNVRTRTARAWPEAEFMKLISELP